MIETESDVLGKRKIYTAEEFQEKFKWEWLKEGEHATNGTDWGFSGTEDNWCINIYKPNDVTEVWNLPRILGRFINWCQKYHRKEGERHIQYELKKLLNISDD